MEAINELMSLMPALPETPVPTSVPTPAPVSSFPSSSSSSSTPPSSSSRLAPEALEYTSKNESSAEQDILKKLGVPRLRKFQGPPFARVHNDSQRLKIVSHPSSNISSPPLLSPESLIAAARFECEHGVRCTNWREHERVFVVEKARSGNARKDLKGNGKGKAKSERVNEIEKMKSELNYPSWDRYVVKLA